MSGYKLVVTLFLLVCLALLLGSAQASADGGASCSFSGTVRLDGSWASGGTLVAAVIEGHSYYTHTAPGSATYSLTIEAPPGQSYADGATVVFKIGDSDAGQTAQFRAGTSQQLDLSAGTISGANQWGTWLFIGAVIALFALGAVAVYFYMRQPQGRVGVGESIKAMMYGLTRQGQRKVQAVEPQEEIWPTYVWDEAKLCWVEAPELAEAGALERRPAPVASVAEVALAGVTGARSPGVAVAVAARPGQRVRAGGQPAMSAGQRSQRQRKAAMLGDNVLELVVPLTVSRKAWRVLAGHLRDLKDANEIKVISVNNVRGQGMRIGLLLRSTGALETILNATNHLPEVTVSPVRMVPRAAGPTQSPLPRRA